LAPFNAIGAIGEQQGDVPYPELPNIQGTGDASPACMTGRLFNIITVGLQEYNITTERKIYNLYNENMAKYPGFKQGTRLFYEGYSNKAVQEVEPASTAFPHRDDHHLLYVHFLAEQIRLV